MNEPGVAALAERPGDFPATDVVVLHVDDDASVGDLVRTFLEREHEALTVRTVTTGEAALDRLEDDLDCVVSDYQMPGMDGLDILDAVKDEHPDLPFILFTGKGSEEIAGEAIARGVDDYMQKRTGTNQYEVLANRILNNVARVYSAVNYRELFEKAAVPMTVRDLETGEVIDVNEQYCDLLGYDRKAALDLTLEDISPGEPPYTAAEGRARLETAVEAGRAVFEWIDVAKDGSRIPVEVRLRVAEIGGRKRILASVIDISERSDRTE